MELWIRSQDKTTLSRVNRIDIDNDGKTILINGFVTIIGIYKSKERTLEVLDEIQKIIGWIQRDMKGVTAGEIYDLNYENFVYQMPKK